MDLQTHLFPYGFGEDRRNLAKLYHLSGIVKTSMVMLRQRWANRVAGLGGNKGWVEIHVF
jgi:hypothetical protein